MSNSQKFDNLLEDLNKEANNLKEAANAYKKLEALTSEYAQISKQFNQHNKVVEQIHELHKVQQEKVNLSLANLENAYRKDQKELSELIESKIEQFRKESKESHEVQQEKINSSLAQLEDTHKKNQTELSKLIETKTEQLRRENKDFYRELEDTINRKLDANKSDIKQLIEYERAKIKEIFEIEFAKNTRELRQVIESEIQTSHSQIMANQQVIKLSVWILVGLTILLAAFMIFEGYK